LGVARLMNILVLNAGSSSLKAKLYGFAAATNAGTAAGRRGAFLWTAHAEWGREAGKAVLQSEGRERRFDIQTPADILPPVFEALAGRAVDAVGHRVVHGRDFEASARITPAVETAIRQAAELAPLHNLIEVEAIHAAGRFFGSSVPQFAVFDTAFHATLPEAARVYPGPYEWYTSGIRRYGFHGISHQFVSARAAEMLGSRDLRLITCHLGNGASLAAVRDGRSIDTTMGFTPLEGLMMGTRSGSIDPGILIYLVRHRSQDPAVLDRLLNDESGLLGVSGISGDMREIEAAIDRGDTRARLAFDVYIHRLCREIGGMAASLGGLDALVFTAGVGENSPRVREEACRRLGFLGIELDAAANRTGTGDREISPSSARIGVLVIHTDEDWQIALECVRLLGAG